jgi:signal transduction histidine kinase
LVLALVLAFWVARWVAAPLQRMAVASRDLADGKYKQIPLEGPTEVRALAEAFNEMSQRVQNSQQSQKDLVANVSHELKTPLTSIQGFAQAILDGTVSSKEELKQAANVIYSESDRMNRLVLDLLDLAKFDAGTVRFNFVLVNMAVLLRDIVKRIKVQAKNAHIQLEESIPGLPEIIGDPDRLSQVMNNLIDNALKHTQPGGKVSICAKDLVRNLEISVSDTGPGIPTEDLSRVFERFYQIEKSRPGGSGRGAGLGLSIAREIILAHKGVIYVQNNRDTDNFKTGCTFVVKLPIASPNRDLTVVEKSSDHLK